MLKNENQGYDDVITHIRTTWEEGGVSFDGLRPKHDTNIHNVRIWYNGTILYRSSQNTTTFKVLKLEPPVNVKAPTIHVGENGRITVEVPKDAKNKCGDKKITTDQKSAVIPIDISQSMYYNIDEG